MAAPKKATSRPKAAATSASCPAAAASPRSFDDIVARVGAESRQQALALRAMVRRLLPDAEEGIFGGAKVAVALYSIGGPARVVCGIGPGADDVLLYLHHLVPADAPALRLGGKGRNCLHLRLSPSEPFDAKAVEAAILLAAGRLRAKE